MNWYWLELLSNSPHITSDTTKLSRVTNSAICFIRDCSAADPSCIGLSAKIPKIGIISSDVSISMFVDLTSSRSFKIIHHKETLDTYIKKYKIKRGVKG